MGTDHRSKVRSIDRPGGRVAFEIGGNGPLIVCVPGMGDLRGSYRFLRPALVEAGFRVAVMDLRGHGDSSASFPAYGDEATAGDVAALVEELGGPAVIVGSSMAAGAAVLVAAASPDAVTGVVLIGPFVREHDTGPVARLVLRLAMAPLWAARSWKAYLPRLYAGAKPTDFAEYRSAVVAALKRPGYAKAFSLTSRTSHDAAERALDRVRAATLVVMGALDPDFPDPVVEARWIADRLAGEVVMIADAGHYPHSQQPGQVAAAVIDFARRLGPDAGLGQGA